MKYNYKKAGALWDRLIDIIWDMPDYFDKELRQTERRYFLRMLTHGEKNNLDNYIGQISRFISEMDNDDADKAKLEKISLEMVLFTNNDNF